MNRKDDEGVVITIHKTDATHGVVHAEPCECHEHIQVGSEQKGILEVIDVFLGDLASQFNAITVGCSDCGWEGFIGPGDKAADEGNKAVVAESDCPECSGNLVDLERDECDHDHAAIEPFYDEEDLLSNDDNAE